MHRHFVTEVVLPTQLQSQSCFDCWNLKKKWENQIQLLSKTQSTIVWTFASSDLSVSLCDWASLWMWNGWDMSGWNCSQQTFDLTIYKLKSVQTKWNLIKQPHLKFLLDNLFSDIVYLENTIVFYCCCYNTEKSQ